MYIPDLIRKTALRRGLSIQTIKTYKQCVKQFFNYCKKDPKEVKKRDIEDYLDKLIKIGCAGNTLNVHLNALKFLYNEILHKRLLINVKFSRTPKKLPIALTRVEVASIFEATPNQKHKLIAELVYSAGLRKNEVAKLKVQDLEFNKDYGWVRQGKGNKDRPFIIARNLKKALKNHISKECSNANSWLFKGQKDHISDSTVYRIIKQAAKKAKIKKNVHPHILRHSFTTHLIEDGYDVATVQSLLGHTNITTTMGYVHTTPKKMINVRSPFDSLIKQ